ncbi:MAG: transcriptional regulator, partial [Desulfobacteraceae bacterium]|nr:transcriptional regulator [Desulfobacteraceae bacterium]
NMKIKETQGELFDPTVMTSGMVLDGMDQNVRDDGNSWPALLAELVDVLVDHLKDREQLEIEQAIPKAQDIIVVIAHHLGGRSIYLPRDDKLKRGIRDAAIYRAFDGSNHLALSLKTKLTTTQIYNIIARQRSLRHDRNQMKLPFPE